MSAARPLPDTSAVDRTALHNFAALRGQLRVSLTPRCNIACFFCHNEDDVPPLLTRTDRSQQPRARAYRAEDFLAVIAAMTAAGVKRVYFTGGEPLSSPVAQEVLTALPPSGVDCSYTLITNGTRVRTHQEWLARAPLDKVKVSLHYFSDESLHSIAGTRIGIGRVLGGIAACQEMFERVELNCLMLKQNVHELESILRFALARRLPIQFIEMVPTEFNDVREDPAVSAERIIAHLRTLTQDEHIEVAGVGQGRRIFRVDGVEIDVIQRSLGRHHVGQCGSCPVRSRCVEGFWALRADHAGGIQPCLLRGDLRLDVRDLVKEPHRLGAAVAQHIARFTEGTL
ncbi:radical SAM protein [Streptomyces tsukubensis]|uniref:radical SAM protein n=1 Tax=Streptomyces tsukubensis TaxID=83656 RepID=UPI00344CDF8A